MLTRRELLNSLLSAVAVGPFAKLKTAERFTSSGNAHLCTSHSLPWSNWPVQIIVPEGYYVVKHHLQGHRRHGKGCGEYGLSVVNGWYELEKLSTHPWTKISGEMLLLCPSYVWQSKSYIVDNGKIHGSYCVKEVSNSA